jgi:hypothetical protein
MDARAPIQSLDQKWLNGQDGHALAKCPRSVVYRIFIIGRGGACKSSGRSAWRTDNRQMTISDTVRRLSVDNLWAIYALVLLSSALWVFASPLLSAYEIITVRSELITKWYCLMGTLIAGLGFVIITDGLPSMFSKRRARCLAFLCALVCVYSGLRWSDRMFLYWKQLYIPTEALSMIMSDLEVLKEKKITSSSDEYRSLPISSLPKHLTYLGRENEFFGAFSQAVPNSLNVSIIRVAYGYQNRRWGIFIGNLDILTNRWPTYKVAIISSNGCFFAGPD